jgi:HK97 family phage portal protein
MKLWPFGRKTEAPVQLKQIVPVGIPSGRSPFLDYILSGNGGYLGYTDAMRFYATVASVASAVDLISDAVKAIPPVLMGPDGKFVESSEPCAFLERPNPFDTREQFIKSLAAHYLLTGDSHGAMIGNIRSRPSEIYAIKPFDVTPSGDGYSRYPTMYMVTIGEGAGTYRRDIRDRMARYLDGSLKEFFRIRSFSSRADNWYSDSPLQAALLEAKQQIQARVHNLSLLQNGGKLTLVATFGDDPTQEELRERIRALNEQVSGASNAGRVTGVSGTDVTFQEFGQNNRDMDFAELDAIAGRAIYQRYKIPLPLISTDASTFNNMETATYHFYDNAALPVYQALMSGLGLALLPRFGLDPRQWSLTYDPEQITALRSRMLDELEKRRTLGIETVNEMRSLLPGREPIQGGNVLYQPANLVPVGTDLYTDDEADYQTAPALPENEALT